MRRLRKRLPAWPAPIALLATIALAGCISYSSSQPARTVVVTPPGSTVVCSNGSAPPC